MAVIPADSQDEMLVLTVDQVHYESVEILETEFSLFDTMVKSYKTKAEFLKTQAEENMKREMEALENEKSAFQQFYQQEIVELENMWKEIREEKRLEVVKILANQINSKCDSLTDRDNKETTNMKKYLDDLNVTYVRALREQDKESKEAAFRIFDQRNQFLKAFEKAKLNFERAISGTQLELDERLREKEIEYEDKIQTIRCNETKLEEQKHKNQNDLEYLEKTHKEDEEKLKIEFEQKVLYEQEKLSVIPGKFEKEKLKVGTTIQELNERVDGLVKSISLADSDYIRFKQLQEVLQNSIRLAEGKRAEELIQLEKEKRRLETQLRITKKNQKTNQTSKAQYHDMVQMLNAERQKKESETDTIFDTLNKEVFGTNSSRIDDKGILLDKTVDALKQLKAAMYDKDKLSRVQN